MVAVLVVAWCFGASLPHPATGPLAGGPGSIADLQATVWSTVPCGRSDRHPPRTQARPPGASAIAPAGSDDLHGPSLDRDGNGVALAPWPDARLEPLRIAPAERSRSATPPQRHGTPSRGRGPPAIS